MTEPLAFPPDFTFGVATSAYQVEGGIENDWSAWERQGKLNDPKARMGRGAGHWERFAEDVGLIAAAYARAQPDKRSRIEQRLSGIGARIASEPSLRFVLTWETDANDVDFHIYDGRGGHAFYGSRALPTGGELYADVTTGYGPECFTIPLPPGARTYPYKLQAHYYSRGPMGYGMGKLEVLEHDGKGGLRFSERPFVIMVDSAFVNLGEVRSQLTE